jgi:hypothetical protein
MSDDNTQGAAEPSGADAGSQPAAYEIHWKRQDGKYMANPYLVFANEQPSEHWRPSPRCVPLYRRPQPAITDGERDAIALAKSRLGTSDGDWQADDVLAALLQRLG